MDAEMSLIMCEIGGCLGIQADRGQLVARMAKAHIIEALMSTA